MIQIRIGVAESTKELALEIEGDGEAASKLADQIDEFLAGSVAALQLTDRKGRTVRVPRERLAYVEIIPDSEGRGVGFSA